MIKTLNLRNLLNVKTWPAIFISLLIIYSALIYYIYALNIKGVFISLILSIISFIILNKYHFLPLQDINDRNEAIKLNKNHQLAIIGYFLFLGASFLEIFSARSVQSLISPWEVVSYRFFIFYIISILLLILILKKGWLNDKINSLLLSLQLFLSLSITIIVYKIGYGFDPFIHQAAMEIIAQNGVINPKTPYYLGQYGLLTSIYHLTGLSLSFLNKILVPLAAALILPNLIFNLVRKISKNEASEKTIAWLTTIMATSFCFSLFFITTPQNLSYLFLLLAIFSGLTDKLPLRSLIFSLATAAIHPIAGIPALIWSSWLIFKAYQHKLKNKWHRAISAIFLSAGALLIPLALFITSGARLQNIKLSLINIISPFKNIFSYKYAGAEDWLLNFVYIIYNHYTLIIIALILCGLYLFLKSNFSLQASRQENYTWRGLISINLSLLLAYLLSSQINFSELIAYEQGGFSRRILTIIILFSSPFLVFPIYWLIKKIFFLPKKNIQLIWLFLLIFFISTSLYLAYPRFDKYFNSRGYSTGELDIEAVKLIDSLASDKYIVLANQQVSAAALQVYGFNNYHLSNGDLLYFYPIPTGGVLYQFYLDMVYKNPDRLTMEKAMDLVGVNEAYLVVNSYWHNSGRIIKAAKQTANSWQNIGNNDIFIFQYTR